jgi:hypothetical protein
MVSPRNEASNLPNSVILTSEVIVGPLWRDVTGAEIKL